MTWRTMKRWSRTVMSEEPRTKPMEVQEHVMSPPRNTPQKRSLEEQRAFESEVR